MVAAAAALISERKTMLSMHKKIIETTRSAWLLAVPQVPQAAQAQRLAWGPAGIELGRQGSAGLPIMKNYQKL